MNVWQEFIAELKRGALTSFRFRPYPSLENLLETIQSGINITLRPHILAAVEQQIEPECFVVGNQLHYILPLGSGADAVNFCFSFLVENNNWYFQHMENIFIRLDQTPPPPTATFPDLSEEMKAWARDEIQVSEMVRLFNIIAAERGKEFALSCFRDGPGYLVGARAWVPFVPPPRAFILYACWDLANLHANPITLRTLDETQAVIQGRIRYFSLYQRAGHLSRQISYEDYYHIFQTVWQDRADCAGWNLCLSVDKEEVTFSFSK